MDYYLYHHGILGQRWGRRNGPPYPLDATDHSSSERKAGWKKSLDKKSQGSYTKDNDSQPKEKKHLTDGQKRAIKIGIAAAATALAAYGTYRLAKSGKLDELAQKGKEKLKSVFGKETETIKFDDLLAGNADDVFKQPKSTSKALGGFRKLAKRLDGYGCRWFPSRYGRSIGQDATNEGQRAVLQYQRERNETILA